MIPIAAEKAFKNWNPKASLVAVFDERTLHLLKRFIAGDNHERVCIDLGRLDRIMTKAKTQLSDEQFNQLKAALDKLKTRMTDLARGEKKGNLSGTLTLFCSPEGGIDYGRYMLGEHLIVNGLLQRYSEQR